VTPWPATLVCARAQPAAASHQARRLAYARRDSPGLTTLAGILLLAAGAVASSAGGPPILRTPTATQLAALSYLTVAVTAVVFLTWYAAMRRLGVDRTGLFNGLIPIASLPAVALAGTGTITQLQCLAALTVLAGVTLGLGHTPQAPADRRSGLAAHSVLAAWLTAVVSGGASRPQ
jgi:drug/metabolite transporter (DMT)-like permease